MKTILLSDIGNKTETIIPYALNFAKFVDSSVHIIHVVDPQQQHAVPSAFADSQSFEIAGKLSHKEIIEREKYFAKVALEKLLSKEASKLNFPLRIYSIVEGNSMAKQLPQVIGDEDLPFIITSSTLEGTVLHNLDEFFRLTDAFNNLSLVVPPGYEFNMPVKISVLCDFESGDNKELYKVLDFLKPFKTAVNIIAVAEEKKYLEMELRSKAWQQGVRLYLGESYQLSTNTLVGENYTDTAIGFIQRNNYDLVAIPRKIQGFSGAALNPKYNPLQFIEHLEVPVILY